MFLLFLKVMPLPHIIPRRGWKSCNALANHSNGVHSKKPIVLPRGSIPCNNGGLTWPVRARRAGGAADVCASRVGMTINVHFDGLSLLDESRPNAIKPQKLWNRNHCFRLLWFNEKFQIGTFLQSIHQNYLKVRIRKFKCDIMNYLVQLYQTHFHCFPAGKPWL